MKLDKVVYTAKAHTTGGRNDGVAKSDDGQLDVKLGLPKTLGGDGKSGANPEQLFAAGYSACFVGALRVVAERKKVKLPDNVSVDCLVDLGPMGDVFGIAVDMTVNIPGFEQTTAQDLVDAAHIVCPYSNATRGNIEMKLSVSV